MTQLYPPPHTQGMRPEDEWHRYQQQEHYPYPPGVFTPGMPEQPTHPRAPFLQYWWKRLAAAGVVLVLGVCSWLLLGGHSPELNPGKRFAMLGAPCVGAHQIVTVSPGGAAAPFWPEESTVRQELTEIVTPMHDPAMIDAELRKVKLALFWTWSMIRVDADDISVNSAFTKPMTDQMESEREEFNDALKRYESALTTGIPSTTTDMDKEFAAEVCGKGGPGA